MRVYIHILILLALGFLIFTQTINAETTSIVDNKAQVIAFVKEAIAYEQKVGLEQALKEFNDPKGKFFKGDLYIYVFYFRGPKKNYCIAHGLYPSWIGKDETEKVDPITKARITPILSQTAQKGGGWVIYHFEEPLTHKIKVKYGYLLPVPGEDFFIGSGFYSDYLEP